MLTEVRRPSKIVDGVIDIHTQLKEAVIKASDIAIYFIGQPISSTGLFYIVVDFSEKCEDGKLHGYFVIYNKIIRFLSVIFDRALLFPIRDHESGEIVSEGLTSEQIENCINQAKLVRIKFRPNRKIQDIVLYNSYKTGGLVLPQVVYDYLDEIGLPYYSFKDIDCLKINDIPRKYLSKNYTLVGKHYYAPTTALISMNCVLFAEIDNKHDRNAIKVLRWFPEKRRYNGEKSQHLYFKGDYFFELGYVSREENEELHKFMVEEKSRILFGEINNDKIKIIGGIKMFLTNNIKYPKSLYSIKII